MKRNTLNLHCFTLVVSLGAFGDAYAQTLGDYQAEVLSQGPSSYFQLDNSLVNEINPGADLSYFGAGGFTYDIFGNPTNTYFFVNNSDALYNVTDTLISGGGIADPNASAKGSITMLFRSLAGENTTGERWIFDGRGELTSGTSSNNALGLFFERVDVSRVDPGSLKLEFGDTTTTILQASNLVYNAWYYFALTYDESRAPNKAIWYLGRPGVGLSGGTTSNATNAVAGDGTGLWVGQRVTDGGAFRSPGNGRVDEFAIWARELSPTEINDQFAQLPATASGVLVTNVIVDDSFADGDRAATGPLQADWWSSSSSSGNSVEVYTNQLGMVTGTSGRGIHGTFTPQILDIGDTIRATYTFTTPATVGTGRSTAFKVALMDFNDPGLAADLTASSTVVQPLYTNLPGYMADMDVNTGSTADTSIREHVVPNTTGRFLGTTGEWLGYGSSADAGYVFTANTEYVGIFSITRTDFDSIAISSSMRQGTNWMDSYTDSDSSDIANNFGMLGLWVNSNTFGSTNGPGISVDNGITFSNIKVEVVTLSTVAPTLNIAQSGSDVVLFWLTTGSADFNLESATSLTAPITWSSNGPPPVVVGDSYVVTNSLMGGEKYYRLTK